jgi:hypothetical protein
MYLRNMIRSDGSQRSVVMPIKVYYRNQTKKVFIGSEKAKAYSSETINLLKDKRFHISAENYLQNFLLFQENILKFISKILTKITSVK